MSTCEARSGERGSVSIVVVAILVALLALTLGAADLARVLVAGGRAQTAADAAALAAAQELLLPLGELPEALAVDYARRNGAGLESCDCDPGGTDAEVRVVVAVGPLLLFSDDHVVRRSARAEVIVPAPGATSPGP